MAWGDHNSANVCPCVCRKRWLIIGYKLSYTTSILYAWSSCMQWGVWVWTVGHWVVLVKVIYCSKGRGVLFLKNQWHHWEQIMSYSHSCKPDLPITLSSPLSMWLSVLFFFISCKNHTVRARWLVLSVVAVTLPSQLPYPHPSSFVYCIVNIK